MMCSCGFLCSRSCYNFNLLIYFFSRSELFWLTEFIKISFCLNYLIFKMVNSLLFHFVYDSSKSSELFFVVLQNGTLQKKRSDSQMSIPRGIHVIVLVLARRMKEQQEAKFFGAQASVVSSNNQIQIKVLERLVLYFCMQYYNGLTLRRSPGIE